MISVILGSLFLTIKGNTRRKNCALLPREHFKINKLWVATTHIGLCCTE